MAVIAAHTFVSREPRAGDCAAAAHVFGMIPRPRASLIIAASNAGEKDGPQAARVRRRRHGGSSAPRAVAAQEVYKERETLMKGFGQRMGVIKGVVVDGKGTLADAATAASEIAGRRPARSPACSPQGSNAGESEALPVIWEQWPDFESRCQDHGRAGRQARPPPPARATRPRRSPPSPTLGKDGCGGCHETFRKKKS